MVVEKCSLMDRDPKALMLDPLAATKFEEDGAFLSLEEAGNTERSAPVSTKKERPEILSNTDKDPTLESIEEMIGGWVVPGASSSRRERFPET